MGIRKLILLVILLIEITVILIRKNILTLNVVVVLALH